MAADGVNLQLTEEERRILRECRINSLYFRGIPLGVISLILTRQAGKNGFLPQFKRFALLYYPGVFTVGLLAGLASYRRTCFEKIMKLENSRLAEQVKEFYSRAGIPYDGPNPQKSHSEQHEPHVNDNQADLDQSEFEAPACTRSVESPRDSASLSAPSLEEPSEGSLTQISSPPRLFYEENTSKPKYTTYEELRKKNRNQLQSSHATQHDAVRRPPEQSKLRDYQSRVGHEDMMPSKKDPPPKRNKYGDIVEKTNQ